MILNSIRDFILTCPLLVASDVDDYIHVRVDYSAEETVTYNISEVPCEPIIKTYIDNSTDRQYLFNFSSVQHYNIDADINLSNNAFYADFMKWLETQAKLGNVPILEEGQESEKLEALSQPYLMSTAEDGQSARYNIQCKLTYYQEK